jgi:hypothetical protein
VQKRNFAEGAHLLCAPAAKTRAFRPFTRLQSTDGQEQRRKNEILPKALISLVRLRQKHALFALLLGFKALTARSRGAKIGILPKALISYVRLRQKHAPFALLLGFRALTAKSRGAKIGILPKALIS